MYNSIKTIIGNLLIKYGNDIKSGTCELNNDELEPLLGTFSHQRLTKEQACQLLNMSRSKFDLYVYEHKLPKGKKIKGLKELIWYKDELLIKSENLQRLKEIQKLKKLIKS